jgi:hypothetical protein
LSLRGFLFPRPPLFIADSESKNVQAHTYGCAKWDSVMHAAALAC